MKISIITATFDSGQTIRDTLVSVAIQNYSNIEHVIVDGNSNDNTLEIVKQFPHVAMMISEKDEGIYDAMNKGIALCTGEVIGILNSDDYYADESVIAQVAEMFSNDPKLDCIYADLVYVKKENTKIVVRKWVSGKFNSRSFYWGWMPPHPTFFVRKRIYEQYGGFNLSLKTAADYELMLRFLHRFKCHCGYLPKTIIKMRTGGASNKNLLSRIKGNQQDKQAWKINGLEPGPLTFILKPLRKLWQYI